MGGRGRQDRGGGGRQNRLLQGRQDILAHQVKEGMSPNAGGGVAGPKPISTAACSITWSPNKLCISNPYLTYGINIRGKRGRHKNVVLLLSLCQPKQSRRLI
jgi:hypothetical protein